MCGLQTARLASVQTCVIQIGLGPGKSFSSSQGTGRYSAMWISARIDYKFYIDKAIAVQVNASDNAFDMYTGGVRFESRPRIDYPIIVLDFCLCRKENCITVCYMWPPFVSTAR
jgi:hypothetical protein